MDNKAKAVQAILEKKPYGLRFKPQEVSYLVTYKEQNGKTYLNYIRNSIRFKCDWKRKLFSTGYTVLSEMVVTDREENNVTLSPINFHLVRKIRFMIRFMNIGVRTFGELIILLNRLNRWNMRCIN